MRRRLRCQVLLLAQMSPLSSLVAPPDAVTFMFVNASLMVSRRAITSSSLQEAFALCKSSTVKPKYDVEFMEASGQICAAARRTERMRRKMERAYMMLTGLGGSK